MYGSGGLRANDLLNYFMSHQFSFNHKTTYSLFLRLGEVIPSNVEEGGEYAGSTKFLFR